MILAVGVWDCVCQLMDLKDDKSKLTDVLPAEWLSCPNDSFAPSFLQQKRLDLHYCNIAYVDQVVFAISSTTSNQSGGKL